jgi:hypothetical protein
MAGVNFLRNSSFFRIRSRFVQIRLSLSCVYFCRLCLLFLIAMTGKACKNRIEEVQSRLNPKPRPNSDQIYAEYLDGWSF